MHTDVDDHIDCKIANFPYAYVLNVCFEIIMAKLTNQVSSYSNDIL